MPDEIREMRDALLVEHGLATRDAHRVRLTDDARNSAYAALNRAFELGVTSKDGPGRAVDVIEEHDLLPHPRHVVMAIIYTLSEEFSHSGRRKAVQQSMRSVRPQA